VKTVAIAVPAGSSEVVIESGLIDRLGDLCRDRSLGQEVLLVSNPTVYGLYGGRVEKSLADAGMNVVYAEIGDGELHKTLASVSSIYDRAIAAGLDRGSVVIGLGGGVVTDVAGFAAATFMRGVDLVQVPTSLLAQVDAAIGGKTGVNHRRGKNLIGAFYQPRLVVIDPGVLKTLPERELVAGMAEVVKYGLIWDAGFYSDIREITGCPGSLPALDDRFWEDMVFHSCRIKGEIVSRDEKENGLRAILNFGHTIGHGLEAAAGYEHLKHGEAVAMGMIASGYISVQKAGLDPAVVRDLRCFLAGLGLPVNPWDLKPVSVDDDDVIEQIGYDKKRRSGDLTFVLLRKVGKACLSRDVSEADMRSALERL